MLNEQLYLERIQELEKKIAFKDEFIFLIVHDLRNPLSIIASALQTMELVCKHQMPERANKFLTTIKQNTNRQIRLVNNLLDITRVSSGHIKFSKGNFDIVYLTKALVNSVELYANQKNVTLTLTSSFSKLSVYLDEEKYERIMLNLLSNALKFTPTGKNIFISLTTKKRRSKNMVVISIIDEGIGIPKDKQTVIFERFGQVNSSLSKQAEGTGLGLYLVKLFVNEMNGEISLKSKIGKGSSFTIILPVVELTALEEIAICGYTGNKFIDIDSHIIQSASIEFSDIYFD